MKPTADQDLSPSLEQIKEDIKKQGKTYIINEQEPQGHDFAHFYFVGKHEGKECIFDTALFTLSLHYSSKLYEEAEKEIMKKYPNYKPWNLDEIQEDNEGNFILPDDVDEEIEAMKAEIMDELEETEAVKVKEYLEIEAERPDYISLNVCLNIENITPEGIEKFIDSYLNDTLQLDDTLYSFFFEEDED